MTATDLGPYEHTGAYRPDIVAQLEGTEPQWSDAPVEVEFDVTGTPDGFCPDCEHAPCVAGYIRFCSCSPRFIGVQRLDDDVNALIPLELPEPVLRALVTSTGSLSGIASGQADEYAARLAYRALVRVFVVLRGAR